MHDLEIHLGIASELVGSSEQYDLHSNAANRQMAGHHKAIAAVVALAAEYQDPARRRLLAKQYFDRTATGVLHQHDTGNAKFLNGIAINFTRLGTSERFHARDCITLPVGGDSVGDISRSETAPTYSRPTARRS